MGIGNAEHEVAQGAAVCSDVVVCLGFLESWAEISHHSVPVDALQFGEGILLAEHLHHLVKGLGVRERREVVERRVFRLNQIEFPVVAERSKVKGSVSMLTTV